MDELIDERTLRNAKLAALKELQKRVKDEIELIEAPIKRDLLEEFTDDRTRDRAPVYVGDVKVGNYIVVPPRLEPRIIPGREEEAVSFLQSLGLTQPQPIKHWEDSFVNVGGKAVHQASGAVCDAIELGFSKAPFVRSDGFKREKTKEAFQALGNSEFLIENIVGFLEEGE